MLKYQVVLSLVVVCCFLYDGTDAASATTRLPNSWNVKDCVNSPKIQKTRDTCKNSSTNHKDIQDCMLKGAGVMVGNNVNLDEAKKLIDAYDASPEIKAALKRDIGRCTNEAHKANCVYQIICKRCLMDPKLKRNSKVATG